MHTAVSTYRHLAGAVLEPESLAGRALLASLFPEPVSRWALKSFRYTTPAGDQQPHHHTADVALCVLQGELTFRCGERLDEEVRVAAGDCIMIPANLPHSETASADGAAGVVAHVHSFKTVVAQ